MGKYLDELHKDFSMHRRMLLSELILKLTDEQYAFFYKVYPDADTNNDDERIETLIGLCERTIRKNEKHNS